MAGGPFGEKVAALSVVAGEDWKGVRLILSTAAPSR